MKKQDISAVMSMLGKRSASKMTKAQRVERARKAVQARWSKRDAVVKTDQ